jgi:GT2 family glycosyltransferase
MTAASPLVSIVTVVLNGAATIERALMSVRAQDHAPIEHHVLDGGSTDGTVAILERHGPQLASWTSAPDRGISDAFNQGLARARGRYVGLLNADDWLGPGQIGRAVAALEASGAAFAFGDLVYHDPAGRPLHVIKGDPGYARRVRRLMPDVNHPTMLVRRSVYEAIGGFDPGYYVAMDYDWLLRAHRAGHRGVYVPGLVGHMTLAGASDRRFIQGLAEVRQIAIAHGLPRPLAYGLFGCRAVKGFGRRALRRLAPASLYHRLRAAVHRGYHTYEGPAA